MKMFDFRKNLKEMLSAHSIQASDADFVISEYLGVKVTDLPLIDEITDADQREIGKLIDERLKFKPVEKIFKKAYFYGLEFFVDEHVLSPRADSEILVDTALKYIRGRKIKTVLDLCTGSGCLAVAVKKNCDVVMTASDVSENALRIAKKNAEQNAVEIKFVHSDMFEKIHGKFDLIISNPPYIASGEIENLQEEVKRFDPRIALEGGGDGLKFYSIILSEAKKHLNENGLLILEIGWDQKLSVIKMFSDFRFVEAVTDYGGRDRVLVFSK